MPSIDDPGADPEGSGETRKVADQQVQSQLVEALMLLLIEKGVLTRNDALSIVQTVAQVQQGRIIEGRAPAAVGRAAIQKLESLYASFEALEERSAVALGGGDNVHLLRPSIYGDRPPFPRDD